MQTKQNPKNTTHKENRNRTRDPKTIADRVLNLFCRKTQSDRRIELYGSDPLCA